MTLGTGTNIPSAGFRPFFFLVCFNIRHYSESQMVIKIQVVYI